MMSPSELSRTSPIERCSIAPHKPSISLDRDAALVHLSLIGSVSQDPRRALVTLTVAPSGIRLVLDEPGVKALWRVSPLKFSAYEPVRLKVRLDDLARLIRSGGSKTIELNITGSDISTADGATQLAIAGHFESACKVPPVQCSLSLPADITWRLFRAATLHTVTGGLLYLESGQSLKLIGADPHRIHKVEVELHGESLRAAITHRQALAIGKLARGREGLVHFGRIPDWLVVESRQVVFYLKQEQVEFPDFEAEIPKAESDILLCPTAELRAQLQRIAFVRGASLAVIPEGSAMSLAFATVDACSSPPPPSDDGASRPAVLDARYVLAAVDAAYAMSSDTIAYHHPLTPGSPVKLTAKGTAGRHSIQFTSAIMPIEG